MGFFARKAIKGFWKAVGKADAIRMASQKPVQGVAGDLNIRYAEGDDPMHVLDVYYPEDTEGLLPVIFDIHGGGWMYGTKETNKLFCMSLASRGFAVVNINYRLVPKVNLLDQVCDVFRALHWLGEHGGEHHCDLDRAFLTGDSAGAHLASLAASITANATLANFYEVPELPFEIIAVALNHIAPSFDGPMLGKKSIDREMKRMLFGKYHESNPIYEKSTIYNTAEPDTYPPVLVITSQADMLFYKHSIKLIEYLVNNKFRCQVAIPEPHPRYIHVYNVIYPESENSKKMNDRIAEFFLGTAE